MKRLTKLSLVMLFSLVAMFSIMLFVNAATLTYLTPGDGANFSEDDYALNVLVTLNTTDANMTNISYYIGGVNVCNSSPAQIFERNTSTFGTCYINTRLYTNGPKVLEARINYAANNSYVIGLTTTRNANILNPTVIFNHPTVGENIAGTYTFDVSLTLADHDENMTNILITNGATTICNVTTPFPFNTTTSGTCTYDTTALTNGAKTFTATAYNSSGSSLLTGTISANVMNPTSDNTACQNTRSTIYVALGLVALFAIIGAAYGLINIFQGGSGMTDFSILAISIIALGVVVLVGYVLMSAVSSAVCTIV